jgi:hypothetical protein
MPQGTLRELISMYFCTGDSSPSHTIRTLIIFRFEQLWMKHSMVLKYMRRIFFIDFSCKLLFSYILPTVFAFSSRLNHDSPFCSWLDTIQCLLSNFLFLLHKCVALWFPWGRWRATGWTSDGGHPFVYETGGWLSRMEVLVRVAVDAGKC